VQYLLFCVSADSSLELFIAVVEAFHEMSLKESPSVERQDSLSLDSVKPLNFIFTFLSPSLPQKDFKLNQDLGGIAECPYDKTNCPYDRTNLLSAQIPLWLGTILVDPGRPVSTNNQQSKYRSDSNTQQ
jgi:hypothetical protein